MAEVSAIPLDLDAFNSDTSANSKKAVKKALFKNPLVLGGIAALLLGGAAAYITMSGIVEIPSFGTQTQKVSTPVPGGGYTPESGDLKYVGIEDLFVSLVRDGRPRQLRLSLSIETNDDYDRDVEKAMPRIRDMLNTYLRAIEEEDLTDPAALDRIRAQILRRMHLILPPEAITDLLVTNFIIS